MSDLIRRCDKGYVYWCVGCNIPHFIDDKWSVDTESGNVSPSVLSRGEFRCHHFVRNGQIQYLSDCDHAMTGKTLDMTSYPDWPRGWSEMFP